jgi:hypothetical protein
MPNLIKYSTTGDTLSLKKGDYYIGVGDVGKGPTEVTGYWNGVDVPSGGYIIHKNKSVNGPAMWLCKDDAEFVYITNNIEGTTFTGATQSLVYYSPMNDAMVFNRNYNTITTSLLSIVLDPSFTVSYPKSGTTFYNIGNNNNSLTFSLLNGVSYSSESGGSLVFDGVDDEVSSDAVYTMTSGTTFDIWVKRTSNGNEFNMMMSHFIPYMAFRGTGSGSDINRYQVAWYGVSGGTQTQRNLYSTGATFSNNIWYNFTYTLLYDLQTQLATGRIYINGVFNGTDSIYSDSIYQPSSIRRLLLGNYINNQYPFTGNIGRFLLYERVLSDSEIRTNYQSNLPIILNENIVTNGLVNYLDAGFRTSYPTTGTTWYDVSGYGLNGTLTNGPTYSSLNGGSIVFDGANDYVNNVGSTTSFSFIQNTGIFTISAWVKLDNLSTPRYFMGNNDSDTIARGFFLGYSGTTGAVYLAITRALANQPTLDLRKPNFFTDNNWVLVTCVGNRTNCQLYKNGIPFDTPVNFSTFATGNSTRTLSIGRINNLNGGYWLGNVALTQIYNRALSSTEVLQNFNAQKSRFGL